MPAGFISRNERLATARRRARAWRNIAVSATRRRTNPDWVPLPHVGHFLITFRCNLKCEACGSWKVDGHQDMTTEEWLSAFRQLRSLDVVKLLGGEPFVRPDIVDILVGAREIIDPYIVQLTTNGMMTRRVEEVIEAIAWPGLQLRISLDGLEETHDRLRGVPGSWQKVMTTARRMAKLRERHPFNFGINFGVNDASMDEMEDMLDLAEDLGADLIPGLWVDPFRDGHRPPEEVPQKVIMVGDADRALAMLEHRKAGLREQLPGIDRVLSRVLVRNTFRTHFDGTPDTFPCRELRDLIYVLPNGDLVRCGLDHEPAGNLREQDFETLWYSDRMKQARAKVDACPGCIQAGVGIMSRLYGGCFFA